MQYAIMLYFDSETEKKIDGYIQLLNEYSNNSYMLESKMPPHITLAMFNSDKSYLEELKEFAENTHSFYLNLPSIGFFNDNEKHIFLSPVKNQSLINIHSKIYNTINISSEEDYIEIYKNNNIWVPHTTIGYQVKKDCFEEALSKCLEIELPIKARVARLAVAVCCPFKEQAVFELL